MFFTNVEMGEFIVMLLIVVTTVALLIFNLLLVFTKNYSELSLNYTIIFSIIQIVHIKIYGFIFGFSSGLELIPYYIYHDIWQFGIQVSYRSYFKFEYDKTINGFLIGISLIPVINVFIFRKILKKFKSARNKSLSEPISKSI